MLVEFSDTSLLRSFLSICNYFVCFGHFCLLWLLTLNKKDRSTITKVLLLKNASFVHPIQNFGF